MTKTNPYFVKMSKDFTCSLGSIRDTLANVDAFVEALELPYEESISFDEWDNDFTITVMWNRAMTQAERDKEIIRQGKLAEKRKLQREKSKKFRDEQAAKREENERNLLKELQEKYGT